MEACNEFYVYLSSNANSIEYQSNKNSGFTNNIKPTLHLQDEFDVALENIIFEPKIIAIEKNDKNYNIQVNIHFTDKNGIYHKGYKVNYTPQNDIHGDTIDEVIYNLNIDFSQFLKKFSMIESAKDTIFYMTDKYVHFNRIQPFDVVDSGSLDGKFIIFWKFGKNIQTLLGLSDEFYGPSLVEKEVSTNCLDTLRKTYPLDTNLKLLHSSFRPKLPRQINCMHVYCDIIEPSYLGGQMVHLLDIIPMNHMYSKKGTLTMYKRVTRTILDDISIQITTEDGVNIPFASDVNVVIILHFKRVM